MEKQEILLNAFNQLRFNGLIKTQKDFAKLLDVDPGQLSRALKDGSKSISDNLIEKVIEIQSRELHQSKLTENGDKFRSQDDPGEPQKTLPVLPTSARAGTLGDFADSIKESDCERMISPIKGADYALQITGESMTPEYPNGSTIIIKKVSGDFLEWGRCYCLDTLDGAVIKLLYPSDQEGSVECRSINPAFPPFKVRTDIVRGWYRVLMCLSLK